MSGVRAFKRKIESLGTALPSLVEKSIDQTKDAFIELNKQQLRSGLNAEGDRLGRYKNPPYARQKNILNPLPGFGNKDYLLTGDYYSQIKAMINSGKITIQSFDLKAQFLERKGDLKFGLIDDNKKIYVQQHLKPVLFKNIKTFLQAK